MAPVFYVVFGTQFGGRVKVQVFACCRCFVRGGSGDLSVRRGCIWGAL